MHLSYEKMPLPLRLLIWLYLIDGCVRVGRFFYGQFHGAPLRLSQIIVPALYIGAAMQLRRGRRDGLDFLLMTSAAFLALLAYGLVTSGIELNAVRALSISWLVLAGGYLLWCRYRLPWRERGSYGHWMSDPDVREDTAAWFAMRDRLVEQDRVEPPDPDELVNELLGHPDLELMRQRLQAQPAHFGMAIFRALDRRNFRKDPGVLNLLIRQLPESLHEPAVERLLQCLPHVAADDRGTVLEILAATGKAELAPVLATELAGEHAEKVAQGLAAAERAGRLQDELFIGVEPALRDAIAAGKDGAAAVVLALRDPALVLELIERSHDLEAHPPRGLLEIAAAGVPLPNAEALELWRHARDVGDWFWCWRLMEHVTLPEPELRALLDHSVPCFGDEEALRDWMNRSDTAPKYSRLTYARALEQLCAREVHDTEDLLRTAIAMAQGEVSDVAALLLGKHLGVPQDWSFEEEDRSAVSHHQRLLATLSLASSYARNGGLEHAFDCLSAEEVEDLEPALEAIAPPEVRDVWLAARREISPGPLPTDREERIELIRSRYDEIESRLDELSSAFYRLTWKLDVAMELYAIEHRDKLSAS